MAQSRLVTRALRRAAPACLAAVAGAAQAAATYPAALDVANLTAWLRQETDLKPEQVVAVSRTSVAAIVSGPEARGGFQLVTVRAEAIDPQLEADDEPVLSTQLQVMVDCAGHRARQGATAAHEQRNAAGSGWIIQAQDGDWQRPSFGTQLENVWRAVCDPGFQRPLMPRAIAAAALAAPAPAAPAPPRAAPPRAALPEPRPRRADPRLRVQIGAYPTMAAAAAAKAAILAHPKRLEGQSLEIAPIMIGSKAYFRLLVRGFETVSEETAFCRDFGAKGRGCFLRNAPASAAGASKKRR